MRKNEKGFTLIELLIVVIILGILAIIGIPKFMNSKADSETASCKTNLSALEDALERYHFDKNDYTSKQSDLKTDGYIKDEMDCPGGGTYTLSSTDGTVSCSLSEAGHTIH